MLFFPPSHDPRRGQGTDTPGYCTRVNTITCRVFGAGHSPPKSTMGKENPHLLVRHSSLQGLSRPQNSPRSCSQLVVRPSCAGRGTHCQVSGILHTDCSTQEQWCCHSRVWAVALLLRLSRREFRSQTLVERSCLTAFRGLGFRV
jgi:hypothetical protein